MLSRAECFKILELDESSGPNAIKRAYRKCAFELHPDLHPDLPDASKRFQQLNEAYVMLMHEYANTSFRSGGKTAGGGSSRFGQPGAGSADERARAEARRAYEQASSRFGANSGQGAGGKNGAETSAGQSAGAPSGAQKPGAGAGTYRSPGREEILRDLLNDPFARRVFEDIYSHVRHGGIKDKTKAVPPPKPPRKIQAKPARSSMVEKVGGKMAGLAGGVRGWLRRQIDDDQTMFLPGEHLAPGKRIRLQVRHGLSDDKKTIEFTLPPEFAPGKPIRLRGLGKRFAGLRGDLYLRVFSDSDEDM